MESESTVLIRPATSGDLVSIMNILNMAITNTTVTFETEPRTLRQQEDWFLNRSFRHPVIVGDVDDEIVGWAALNCFSPLLPYQYTAEISVYVDTKWQGKGIGKKLTQSILSLGQENNLHTIIARITGGNEASLHLHRSLGFKEVGVMKEVGIKFGQLLDVHYLQKIY
ncbi:GNAT family N-acetyltransferase [Aneurinibacillus terranovensis]|uniref:GNAT family N-acetyltransferase n=1 Tax=Aneurinibacillus terranovensis TaxID=278991 RepID=UPI0004871D2B|nr:GNAT family N-acetyltransferase [Aneurinibacillus terranovensis]